MRLDGRVALVTGASRGIGAEVCRAYAREGAAVAVNHFPGDEESAQAAALVDELRAAGARAVAIPADVSVRADVDAMVACATAELGPVDVLVANAAASGRSPWREIDEQEWRRITTTNLDGLLFCAQAVHDGMRERGRGAIVTVSSVMVELGATDALHYVTTKAGIIGFTRALAREVGADGITVNCVMPGAIRTEHELATYADQEGLARQMAEKQSIPRRGIASDLSGAFVFLASAESAFVTGQVLTVDGGWVNY